MILTAFDVKFSEKKDELPPGACRPSKKLETNNVHEVDHQQVKNKKTMSKQWTPKQPKKTMSNKWVHILLYTFIYLHIPPNSFIYLQIALYTFIYPHTSKY